MCTAATATLCVLLMLQEHASSWRYPLYSGDEAIILSKDGIFSQNDADVKIE